MAVGHNERRREVLDWMSEALEYFLEPDVDITPAIIDHIAYSLLQIRAIELLPTLKDLYLVYPVPKIECRGGYRWLKKAMPRGEAPRIPFNSIDLFLKMYIIMDDEAEEWDDDEWDDDTPWETPMPENPFYLTTDRPLKLMTIEVKLCDSPTEVVRTLSLPSSLRLSCLGKVLELAMGFQNGSEQYFRKNLDHYVDTSNNASEGPFFHDWTQSAVNEVLFRKKSEMRWIYEQEEVWWHDITVTKTQPLQETSIYYEVSLISGTGSVWPGKPFDLSKARQEIDDYMGQSLPF